MSTLRSSLSEEGFNQNINPDPVESQLVSYTISNVKLEKYISCYRWLISDCESLT